MKNALLCLLIFSTLFLNVHAQNITVSGKVLATDDDMGLPGVTIMKKGTGLGTTTDMNGDYVLSGLHHTDTLVFRYVGYEPMEVLVGAQKVIDVELIPAKCLMKLL